MIRNQAVAGHPDQRYGGDKNEASLRVEVSDATENVASWLQDVARRPWPQESRPQRPRCTPAPQQPAVAAPVAAGPAANAAGARNWRLPLRHAVIMTALGGAFMQYYFIDVNLRIVSMHSVTVFAPTGITRSTA